MPQQIVLPDYIHAVQRAEERVVRLTRQIEELAPSWSLAPLVQAFQAMRGVAFIVAVTVVTEVGDFARFANPRQLMAYLGLVQSQHSTGSAIRRGGITKAGNALARRTLIEGAWTYRMQARISRKLHDRIEGLPEEIREIAWKAQVRLCSRYRRMAATGKTKVVITTAIAREMAGFLWAIARHSILRRSPPERHRQSAPRAGGRARLGTLVPSYEPAGLGRRSPSRRRQPRDETTVMR